MTSPVALEDRRGTTFRSPKKKKKTTQTKKKQIKRSGVDGHHMADRVVPYLRAYFQYCRNAGKKKNKTRSNAVGQNPTSHRQKDVDDERTPNLT